MSNLKIVALALSAIMKHNRIVASPEKTEDEIVKGVEQNIKFLLGSPWWPSAEDEGFLRRLMEAVDRERRVLS